jgi:hypothetical protein
MALNYPKKHEAGVVVRTVVSVELADKLRRMATEENRTLSDMIALLLARAVEIRRQMQQSAGKLIGQV